MTAAASLPPLSLMPGAEPYFQRGGPTGCLCLHGFTASPHEVLWLGQHLAREAGHTVYIPRLAGHGTQPQDLARVRWWDWLHTALDGVHLLRQQCERVYVCGLSMGGLVALLTSLHTPVDGLIVMAAPLELATALPPNRLRLLKLIRPWSDQTDHGPFAAYIADEQRRRGEPVYGRVRYNRWSTAGVEQLVRLSQEVAARLPEVTAPLLALYSEADATVPISSVKLLQARVRSKPLEVAIFKTSGHILTQDVEHPQVFQRAAAFIAAQGGG